MNQNLSGNTVYHMENASLSYYDLKAGYSCEYVSGDNVRLVTVFTGSVEYSFGTEEVCQSNLTLLLLPPYSRLRLHVIDPARLMVLEVADAMVKTVYRNTPVHRPFNEAINHPRPYVEIRFSPSLYDCVQKVHGEYVNNKENPYLVELLVCKLLYMLLQTEYSCYLFSIKAAHPMEQVKFYIQRNIRETIKISTLARLVGMNNSNFTNTFKRYFGKTPLAYIQFCKMTYAETLLKENSVTDVAFDMGYENVSTFITHFKNVHKVTPKQYQLAERAAS